MLYEWIYKTVHASPVSIARPKTLSICTFVVDNVYQVSLRRLHSISHLALARAMPSALDLSITGDIVIAAWMCGGYTPSVRITDPMARKKEKVAALLNMY